MEALMQQVVYGFNSAKLDWIMMVKNVWAVLVRQTVPTTPPPSSWWIWIDTVWWKSYMATGTSSVTDRSILWNLWWSVVPWAVAIWNGWGLTSYSDLTYTSATSLLYTKIFNALTEYRVGGTKVVWARQTASYTSDPETSAYTGIDNAQAGAPYAQLTDINQLRVAYEALRAGYENLRTALQTHWLIS